MSYLTHKRIVPKHYKAGYVQHGKPHLRTTGVDHLPWDYTMLLAIRHKLTHPGLTPASKAGTPFTYPRGMEGWVDQVDLITRFTPRPGVEPATAWSKGRRPKPLRHQDTQDSAITYCLLAKFLRHCISGKSCPAAVYGLHCCWIAEFFYCRLCWFMNLINK